MAQVCSWQSCTDIYLYGLPSVHPDINSDISSRSVGCVACGYLYTGDYNKNIVWIDTVYNLIRNVETFCDMFAVCAFHIQCQCYRR